MSTSLRNHHLTHNQTVGVPRPTRRSFLQKSVNACLALGLLKGTEVFAFGQGLIKTPTNKDGYFTVPEGVRRDSLMLLQRSSFARYNGDHFETANDSGEPVILNLFKVEDLRSQRALFAKRSLAESEVTRLKEESFSLIFRGPLEMPLRQRIYRLKHHTLDKLELFLVPVGKDDGARYYEAVFNRTQQ